MSIYNQGFGDQQRQNMAAGGVAGGGGYMGGSGLGAMASNQGNLDPNFQKFLQSMGMMAANRGVNKAPMTPAMMNGQMPRNPSFFGMEPKQPAPYQKVVLDKQNLEQVMKGYQELTTQMGGPSSHDTATLISNVRRSESIIAGALNRQKDNSIFAGVPTSSAKNLYEIGLKNTRQNSIYALV